MDFKFSAKTPMKRKLFLLWKYFFDTSDQFRQTIYLDPIFGYSLICILRKVNIKCLVCCLSLFKFTLGFSLAVIVFFTLLLIIICEETLRNKTKQNNILCCFICLDLHHSQKKNPVYLLVFLACSLEQEQCLKNWENKYVHTYQLNCVLWRTTFT